MTDQPATMPFMQIARRRGPEVLETGEVARPAPQEGQALVRVAVAAVNNTDLWTREGAYGSADDPDALPGWRGPIDFPWCRAPTLWVTSPPSDPAETRDPSADAWLWTRPSMTRIPAM